jgi:cytochrome c5
VKKKKLKNILASLSVLAFAFVFVSFTLGWVVPASDAAVKNPVKSSAASIAAGKTIYIKSCKMCHGETGVGAGKMAGTSNFTLPAFKSQTDGAIYYKINTGFGRMPGYKTKIAANNDRWNLVNYLRSL